VPCMYDDATQTRLLTISQTLADETRLRILATLSEVETTSMTVTDLAQHLQLAQPRISTHLAILLEAGLVEMRAIGRTRVYRAVTNRVQPALDGLRAGAGLEALPPRSPAAARALRLNTPYRISRTCYDHLAGRAAVDLLDGMIFDRWLVRSGGPDERPHFEPTETGLRAFDRIGIPGVSLACGRRRVACGCLDWTERKPHLGGALGAAVFASLTEYGYVDRKAGTRDVTLLKDLDGWLGERKPG